jgi:hypothetical protein
MVLSVTNGDVPQDYKSLDRDDWIEAVDSEMSSLQENKTWVFCTLFDGRTAIRSK